MKTALAFAASVGALAIAGFSPPPAGPVVVELFTSQGCSSCPPANDYLAVLAARRDVLALSFGVTYWDQLGWRDTFASPAFTARQRDYDRRLHAGVFTPQMVVDGRRSVIGSRRGEVDRAIAASAGPTAASVRLAGGKVMVGPGAAPPGGADVWLVRYDPRVVQVPVRAGENGGRTLPHRNVVRALIRLGRWDGRPTAWPITGGAQGLALAAIVQAPDGGPVLAAARAGG